MAGNAPIIPAKEKQPEAPYIQVYMKTRSDRDFWLEFDDNDSMDTAFDEIGRCMLNDLTITVNNKSVMINCSDISMMKRYRK